MSIVTGPRAMYNFVSATYTAVTGSTNPFLTCLWRPLGGTE
eukprot:COSAG01_NODE_3990_length_5458_cov_2.452323_4_plen_41_part_00